MERPRALPPVLRVAAFTAARLRRSRRTRVFVAVSLLPVLLAAILQAIRAFAPARGFDGPAIFANIILAFDLQFLILILALFYGTAVVSEEVEGRTLTYLSTRPVSKAAIVVGKWAAYSAFLIAVTLAGVAASFAILNFDRLGSGEAWGFLGRAAAALGLGLAAYGALFTLVGAALKRSILFGLLFAFGWENIVPYFPGSTQRFTLMHYLKSLVPGAEGGKSMSFLLFRLEPSPAGTAVAVLATLTAVFLGLACWLFGRKEYPFEE